ncbi:MAG: hypothetical protein K0R60_1468 [Microbacterium sp.]|nr:hypothetical protein [Microbacterium sp.]
MGDATSAAALRYARVLSAVEVTSMLEVRPRPVGRGGDVDARGTVRVVDEPGVVDHPPAVGLDIRPDSFREPLHLRPIGHSVLSLPKRGSVRRMTVATTIIVAAVMRGMS